MFLRAREVESTHDGVRIRADVLGDGAPILLLHGYPQTRFMWHRVIPALAEKFRVIVPDLRGYGDSDKPAGDVYDKRRMAADQVALMHSLGHERWAVVGHDRGARVAHRMALDEPQAITAITVMDIVPTLHMFDNVDAAMAAGYFHWFFLTRPDGMPEALIRAAPEAWLRSRFEGRSVGASPITEEAWQQYLQGFVSVGGIEATCADYRAAATVDLELDRADHDAGRRLSAPLLALWGASSYVGRNFDVENVWRTYADRVTARALPADHYLAEEAPEATLAELLPFLAEHASDEESE